MKSQVTFSKEKRTMLAFAMIADTESGREIIDIAISERAAIKRINTLLGTAAELSGWKLVFNPAIYKGESLYAENTTMIFYNSAEQHMVVAIAGTNVTSKYDWFTEDFEVKHLVPWTKSILESVPRAGAINPHGFISQGTSMGICYTSAVSNTTQKMTPLTWLSINLATSSYPTKSITVTGHSLGGALAPVFALGLKDYPSNWNPHGLPINVNAYSFAGPTPGDINFRNYLESRVPLNSTINTKDVVPHAWELDMLNELFSLYDEKGGKPIPTATADNDERIIYWLVKFMISKSQYAYTNGHQYVRWNNETKITNSTLSPTGAALEKEAKELSGGIYGYWKDTSNTAAINALESIIGETSPKGHPFFTAFCKYVVLLGQQHTSAYENHIFNNPTFQKELKKIFKSSKISELGPAAKIIGDLMIQVAAYKASQKVAVPS